MFFSATTSAARKNECAVNRVSAVLKDRRNRARFKYTRHINSADTRTLDLLVKYVIKVEETG
jgi:hypothetical protein